ncbi:MAG: hypothetical protein ACTSSP_09815 [Candidatus Asgardarchaeia archaeon]
MKVKNEYINFVEIEKKPKTKVYSCKSNSNGDELGRVQWYAPWRQYVFSPILKIVMADVVVFNKGCLDDIGDFIGQLNVAHKEII